MNLASFINAANKEVPTYTLFGQKRANFYHILVLAVKQMFEMCYDMGWWTARPKMLSSIVYSNVIVF